MKREVGYPNGISILLWGYYRGTLKSQKRGVKVIYEFMHTYLLLKVSFHFSKVGPNSFSFDNGQGMGLSDSAHQIRNVRLPKGFPSM